MRGLRAALGKDLRLFFSGAGWAALLLPLALLAALCFGTGQSAPADLIRPFPVAVRDLDETIMSRSLISQMERLELFSQVRVMEPEESDEQALYAGAAAAVTIPKDFFYDLYTMEDCPVQVSLNGEMPLESTLFQAIFSCVMDIIRADQAAGVGLYRFCYGEMTPELMQQLYARSSRTLIQDALGRQTVFSTGLEASDLAGALERRLFATLLSVISLFFALSAVKTLPEELHLGVLPRFRAAGGRLWSFICAKLLLCLTLSLPCVLVCLLLLRPEGAAALLGVSLLLTAGCFGVLLCLAAWSKSALQVQRRGNLILLLSLAFGGTLWPQAGGILAQAGRFSLPRFALLGVEGAFRALSFGDMLALLWPVPAAGAVGVLLALPGLGRCRSAGRPADIKQPAPCPPCPAPANSLTRLSGLAGVLLKGMCDGWQGLIIITAAVGLCALACLPARGGVQALKLAVCDLDQSPLSQELTELLSRQDGVSVTLCTPRQGERMLLLGEAEGLLTLPDGYGQTLRSGGETELVYQGASSAVTVQGAREIIAGQVIVQTSRQRALRQAGEELGRDLTLQEENRLLTMIDRQLSEAPPASNVRTLGGASAAQPFLPSPMSFAALACLLLCFTAAGWSVKGQIMTRVLCQPRGGVLYWGSCCLALTGLGMAVCLAVLLPAGQLGIFPLVGALACCLCAAPLSLLLARFTGREGRVDGLAPFLALILCLAGGCFLDMEQMPSGLGLLSLIAPPGLAVRAGRGSVGAVCGLLAQGAVCFWAGVPRRKHINTS